MYDANVSLPRTAVIGAGLMGHGIAQEFMAAGAITSLWDPDEDTLHAAPDRMRRHLAQLHQAADSTPPEVTVRLASSMTDAVRGVDLVVEVAPERLELKRELLREVQREAPKAIFASNTSALRISEIAESAENPQLVVGTHWWNPPYLIPIVEVIHGEQTSQQTVNQVIAWLSAVGKDPVEVCKDTPGFVGNRMQFALVREAAHIVAEGIATAETVDAVVRGTMGRRWSSIGPLRNSDFIGLDLVDSILSYLSPSLATDRDTPALFRELIERGDLGAKSGRGVYSWAEGEREDVENKLIQHLITLRQLDQQQGRDA